MIKKRWRVMLDFGQQFQTVYVRAWTAEGALRAAESTAPGRCLAVLNHITVADDQTGPVDAESDYCGALRVGAFDWWDNPCPRRGF